MTFHFISITKKVPQAHYNPIIPNRDMTVRPIILYRRLKITYHFIQGIHVVNDLGIGKTRLFNYFVIHIQSFWAF